MLFSNETVAKFINENFEAAWESVRPVPMIHMDFGNGKTITRTLSGNIATYLCTPDGQVLDVVCGVYDAPTYLDRLSQGRLLAHYVSHRAGQNEILVGDRQMRLKQYHHSMAEAQEKKAPPPRLVNLADRSKAVVEGGVKAVLVSHSSAPPALEETGTEKDRLGELLEEDRKLNETERRLAIHQLLRDTDSVKPHDIYKRIYKDILHADLDDPYLGLGHLVWVGPQPPL